MATQKEWKMIYDQAIKNSNIQHITSICTVSRILSYFQNNLFEYYSKIKGSFKVFYVNYQYISTLEKHTTST